MNLFDFSSMWPALNRLLQSAERCHLVGMVFTFYLCLGSLYAETVSLDLGDGVKMEFVWIPVDGNDGQRRIEIGDFTGVHAKEPNQSQQIWGPFSISKQGWGYYLGKTEVSEAQWAMVMGEGHRSQTPIVGKKYLEIQAFVETLNFKAERGSFPNFPQTADGATGVIRLPNEAEWEYAARGGDNQSYAASDPYKGDLERHEVFSSPTGGGQAREVASKQANSLGIFDMLGNVREFVEGSYTIGGRVGGYIIKGGSFATEGKEIRASMRAEQPRTEKSGQASRSGDVGFRVCISSDVFTSLDQAKKLSDKLKVDAETKSSEDRRRLDTIPPKQKAGSDTEVDGSMGSVKICL